MQNEKQDSFCSYTLKMNGLEEEERQEMDLNIKNISAEISVTTHSSPSSG